ncbi:MAG: HAD family hydrolase [Haloferacaceae archaeon]
MYDAVVLDSDGVLVGLTDRGVVETAIERTYRSFGVTPSEADRAALDIGTTPERVRAACDRHGLDPDAVWERRDRTISELEREAIRTGEKPLYDDVRALDALDHPLGVASNNVRPTVEFVLDRHGLTDRVGAVHARSPSLDSLARRKPDPHLVRSALADLEVDRALFVGDSASDVRAAERAGVDAALLARPDHGDAAVADGPDPDHTIGSLAALPDLVSG